MCCFKRYLSVQVYSSLFLMGRHIQINLVIIHRESHSRAVVVQFAILRVMYPRYAGLNKLSNYSCSQHLFIAY